jgi:hypothetical protein
MVSFTCPGWETSIISSNGLDMFFEIRPNWPNNYRSLEKNIDEQLADMFTKKPHPTRTRAAIPAASTRPAATASTPYAYQSPPLPLPNPLLIIQSTLHSNGGDGRRNTEGGRRRRRLQPAGLLLWIHPARRHHRTHRSCTLTAVQKQVA